MRPPVDAFPRLAVETLYEPASDEAKLGGDFYDAFSLPGDRMALVVGDVCGQGLTAAAWSAEVKYALRAFLFADGNPEPALAQLNGFLTYARAGDTRTLPAFVALSLAVIETQTGRARLAVAGIEPPLVLRAGGRTETAMTNGLPLGIAPGERYAAETLSFQPGDILIQVTDGITEARAPQSDRPRGGALLGYEGFVRLALAAHGTGSLRALGQAILEGARTFSRGMLRDDVCLLLARWE
jgi:serine phosphatase RsbU (regulator of sigma subunit)